ncbi:hypothetical protein A3A25_03080 [Candidatus Azambacteria bacterium RIFCSPLOWO2_01_FULL_46_26]|uniref:histidine kinase n=1 Tax=Candidatus Azambacteria bacterium RIFCSPLOWO2_01_FULL_46_26 TaxID=1797299 RepID=A0A1F5C956_9BACT|nr:MAG: hypothetical protein A3A25_03080 [Candidatus Azambacteria bacterium RIFCSPLOWO2_01_FULL_46_26]
MSKKFTSSLWFKLFFSFLAVFAVSVSISSYLSYRTAKENLTERIKSDVRQIAEAKEGSLLDFISQSGKRVVDFSSDGFIRDSAAKIVAGENGGVAGDLNRHLNKNKMSLDPTIFGINVTDLNGRIIASTMESELGRDESKDDYFVEAKQLAYGQSYAGDVMFSHHFNKDVPHFAVLAPLTEKETGEKLGFIINYIDGDELTIILNGSPRPLERDEKTDTDIYLVNKDGLLISKVGTLKNGVLKQIVDSEPVMKCKSGEEMSDVYYAGWRGMSVIGASKCLANGWTLLAEIDNDTAFAGLSNIGIQVLFSSLLLLVVVTSFVFFLIRGIVKPVNLLSEVTKRIAAGDLSQKVKVRTKDEIGELADSFQTMTQKLLEKEMLLRVHRYRDRVSHELTSEVISQLELVGIEKTKGEFISIASHQLRTPLTSMKWLSDLILGGYAGSLTEEQKELIMGIRESNERLIALVRDLLSTSRLEGGRLELNLKETELLSFLQQIIDELAPQIQKRRHELIFEKPAALPRIRVDQELTKHTFLNLLTNAIRYTKPGGKIVVSVNEDAAKGRVTVAIKDNGIGIPESFQKEIFERFARTQEAIQMEPDGTGLGVYIAKKAVEAQGGAIWFESKTGVGTTFYFSLPIKL